MKRLTFIVAIAVLLAFPAVAHAQDAPLPEDATLENILAWLVAGGCGVAAFFIIEKFFGARFHDLTPETKQYVASAVSGGIAVLAAVGLVLLGAENDPGNGRAWVDMLLPVFFIGAKVANLTHARVVLREASE